MQIGLLLVAPRVMENNPSLISYIKLLIKIEFLREYYELKILNSFFDLVILRKFKKKTEGRFML